MLVLIYDAAGFAVARRMGDLHFRVQMDALPMWKLTAATVMPPLGYVACMVAAFWAYSFAGLVGLVVVWFLLQPIATRVFATGVLRGRIEANDVIPCRWIPATIGAALALVSLGLAVVARL